MSPKILSKTQVTIICDEYCEHIINRLNCRAVKLIEFDFEYMRFLVVGNVDTDIVGLRQHNNLIGGGGLSAQLHQ